MKKIITLLLVVFILGSCKNEDWEFPDFDYTTSYFPYQYPIRTLILGNYNTDNTGDKDGRFLISATMGGVYENKENIKIDFVIDESLTNNLYSGTTKIVPMPRTYYTLSNDNQIIIPKGEFSGGVEVQLTEGFFNDLLAVSTNYVIPLRITGATTDSVLQGSTGMDNADPRIASNWVKTPKDFTLFAVRFVNELHGRYLLRGKSVFNNNGTPETITYRKREVEQDEIVAINTSARRKVIYTNSVRKSEGSPGNYQIELSYGDNGDISIVSTPNSDFAVTGNGRFVENGDEWGGKKRDVIYMQYIITEGVGLTHTVNDTLVFRDKNVRFEEFKVDININN